MYDFDIVFLLLYYTFMIFVTMNDGPNTKGKDDGFTSFCSMKCKTMDFDEFSLKMEKYQEVLSKKT